MSLASWRNGCLGKGRKQQEKAKKQGVFGKYEHFGLAIILCAGNRKDKQNFCPKLGHEAGN